MTDESNPTDTGTEQGEVDDATEAAAESSTTDGAAAQGDYDPTQGSPAAGAHPTAESFPDESAERPTDG